jgi:hypothetical protein
LKTQEKIIDIYGDMERVVIEALKYHTLNEYDDVEIITIIPERHYQLILYKKRKVGK